MKKILLYLIFLFNYSDNLFAQNPLVKMWDYRFGGNDYDDSPVLRQTSDKGFFLCGVSRSDSSGDVSQPNKGYQDFWIVKLDSLANKQWDKRFGGDTTEVIGNAIQTSDGGYMIAGYTWSDSSGDVSQHQHSAPPYSVDSWVIKIDALGNKQWDKIFGGNQPDVFYTGLQTSDDGYLFAGNTFSDSTGDISHHLHGANDFWIVKTDSQGNKQWDKNYGGQSYELITAIKTTSDGGFILAGYTQSDSSGDVSQHIRGISDGWIIKIDSVGTKQWDKRFGGDSLETFFDVLQTTDNGYLLSGWTVSDSSADVSQPTRGSYDYWMVKTDSIGNKQWDKRFGGSNADFGLGNIIQTNDGGFLQNGTSWSGIGGDKTEYNQGIENSWLVKTDASGNIQWDKTIFCHGETYSSRVIQLTNGCYIIATGTDGDSGGYKTQPSQGFFDYWMVEFCDTTVTSGVFISEGQPLIFISPNPFSKSISIEVNKPNVNQMLFVIQNILGQTIYSKQENNLNSNNTEVIDLSFLPKGIYILEIIIDGVPTAIGRTVKKIIKE